MITAEIFLKKYFDSNAKHCKSRKNIFYVYLKLKLFYLKLL